MAVEDQQVQGQEDYDQDGEYYPFPNNGVEFGHFFLLFPLVLLKFGYQPFRVGGAFAGGKGWK